MNITVYCGSVNGIDNKYSACAKRLGQLIADNGHTLVFGASNTGLMGVLCNAVMQSGGDTIGVVPDIPFIAAKAHPNLTRRIDTADLSERKKVMMELGDAYVALPGGLGTLDEISEIIEISRIGAQDKPIVLINTDGFYEGIKQQIKQMKESGFLGKEEMANVYFAEDAKDCMEFIETF